MSRIQDMDLNNESYDDSDADCFEGMNDMNDDQSRFASIMVSSYLPQQQQQYLPGGLSNDMFLSRSEKLVQSTKPSLKISEPPLQSATTAASFIVKNRAPMEPFTVLPLSFYTQLPLETIISLTNETLSTDAQIKFQVFTSEATWFIEYQHEYSQCSLQLNVYESKTGRGHIFEGHRREGDGFAVNNIFQHLKNFFNSIENRQNSGMFESHSAAMYQNIAC